MGKKENLRGDSAFKSMEKTLKQNSMQQKKCNWISTIKRRNAESTGQQTAQILFFFLVTLN